MSFEVTSDCEPSMDCLGDYRPTAPIIIVFKEAGITSLERIDRGRHLHHSPHGPRTH